MFSMTWTCSVQCQEQLNKMEQCYSGTDIIVIMSHASLLGINPE